MTRKFKTADYDKTLDLQISMREAIGPDHLVRFIVDMIAQLDLKGLYRSYARLGAPPYAPEVLLGLLFYGYTTGVFSSRNLERATYEVLPFRFVSGDMHPDQRHEGSTPTSPPDAHLIIRVGALILPRSQRRLPRELWSQRKWPTDSVPPVVTLSIACASRQSNRSSALLRRCPELVEGRFWAFVSSPCAAWSTLPASGPWSVWPTTSSACIPCRQPELYFSAPVIQDEALVSVLSASLTPVNSHYELVKLVKNLLDSGLPPTFLDFSDRLLGVGITPSCCSMPSWSKTLWCSLASPMATRQPSY